MATLPCSTNANTTTSYYALASAGAGSVSQIVAGTGVSVSPSGGTGVVTISATAEFVSGMIVAFNSAVAPTGWAICDGTSGTPDLRDRFILGASATYPITTLGGNSSATLTLSNLPDHVHGSAGLSTSSGSSNTGGLSFANAANTSGITSPGWTGPQSFSVLNPFYALTYIMKL